MSIYPQQKIIHTFFALFGLLFAAIIANAIFAGVNTSRDNLRHAGEDSLARLNIAKSAHNNQLETLRIISQIAKEQNAKFCHFIDYDNLPAMTYMLKSLVEIHDIDFATILGEDQELIATYPGTAESADAQMRAALLGRGETGVSLVELSPGAAKNFLPQDLHNDRDQANYIGFRAVIPLIHDTGDPYGHIILVKMINGNERLMTQMTQLSDTQFTYFGRDKSALLSSFPLPGMPFPESATVKVGKVRYYTAVVDLFDASENLIGHLSVAHNQQPYITQRKKILVGTLLPFFLTMVMSIILFILLKTRVFDRVNILSAALRQVTRGQGDMSIRVPAGKTDAADEVEYMLHDFNHMMQKLEHTSRQMKTAREEIETINKELEERVQERTAQLSQMFQDLKIEVEERQRAVEQQQALQKSLERARKMESLGTLAGGIAHDLNNILSGLVSYPELLLLELPADSTLRGPITTIKTSGEKAATIVQDLLTLTRRGVATFEPLNINTTISDYLASLEYKKLRSHHPDTKIRTDLDATLHNIMGSQVHLSKVIMNLVSNAAEALPQGGQIDISTTNRYLDSPIEGYAEINEGAYVCLCVSDTGEGIGAEDLERIFEPFFTKKRLGRSGTGLGMSVVWGTVEDHTGYIDVSSQEGRGTTFKLYFPACKLEAKVAQADVSLDVLMGDGESVLIVDDVQEQREIASKMALKLGYEAMTVPSGEAAIEYVKDNQVDVLILDMLMPPGIDGLSTYQAIIDFRPGQRAIIASGFSETERVKNAQQLGASEYIKKPYSLEKLGLALKTTLAQKDCRTNHPSPP